MYRTRCLCTIVEATLSMMIVNGIGVMIALVLLNSHSTGKTVQPEPGEMLDTSAVMAFGIIPGWLMRLAEIAANMIGF